MKTILLIVLMTISWSLNSSKSLKDVHSSECIDVPALSEKIFLYPNPATTELNIEFGDQSFADAVFMINDASGRRYVMIPVKGRERLTISLDRRFVPGDYDVSIIRGKNRVSKSFSVVE